MNIDSTVCLEAPMIKKYSDQMRSVIAGILEINAQEVSVKATTTEKMGSVGREEGLVAYATVLLARRHD
jgi:2-C-methyl-D-erythritol 2,4-cyclodiphosphate synthase